MRARTTSWAAMAAAVLVTGYGVGRLGLPSPYLFAAIVVGLAFALLAPRAPALPALTFRAGQAVTGVVLGTYLHASTLTALGSRWLPVIGVSAATLALTIVAGLVLARIADVSRATGSLGMVAGGASGIVAMADELGADDRIVAFMQYLRVLVIVLATPILVKLAFPGHALGRGPAASGGGALGTPTGWALTLAVAPAGALLAARIRMPAASLLGPLLLAAALTLSGGAGATQVPPLARDVAFASIGLQIGLRFERATIRAIARLLLPVLASIVGLVAGCFALAWLLSLAAHVSLLEAYLATTPGGLYAVLAVAVGAGSNTTFVLAVQGLRLFVMVLAAPALIRVLVRRGADAGRRRAPPEAAVGS